MTRARGLLTTAGVTAVATVVTMYPTIYLHELAHSVAAWALDCKADWFSTDTSPWLWGSYGGAIDYPCLRRLGSGALAVVDGAGAAANVALMAAAGFAAGLTDRRVARACLLAFALANHVEAFSYLVVNTIVPRSDMLAVLEYLTVPAWVLSALSALLAGFTAVWVGGALLDVVGAWIPRRRAFVSMTAAALVAGGLMVAARAPLVEGAGPSTTFDAAPDGSPRSRGESPCALNATT